MVVLESFPKHNLVAYLEKTDGNTEFHEIISFLTYITAKVAGKPVSISEASIRSNLLFDDADGIDSLPNQAIFDAIRLMGFISVFLDKQLKNVPVPLDHFPINALTSKVFSFMVKKGKHFLGNATPLFDSMLVQPTEDEGDTLERQFEPQPLPSPPHLSADQHETHTDPSPRPSPTTHIPDSILEGSSGNHGDQAKEIKHLKAQIKKLKKKAKPVITHHRAWMKSGRKFDKAEPTVHKDPAFNELDDDEIDYMETEDAQDVGRTRYVVHEEKESAEKEVSTEDALSTAQPKVSTDKPEVSTERPDEDTDKQKVSTDKEEVSTDRPDEGTVDQNEGRSATQTAPTTTTPTIFGDDETIAQPLPKIDLKDKGKKKIEEEDKSNTESEGITEDEKKFKQLARDEEVARKVQEDWEAEEEVKKLAEEEATKAAFSNEYDFIQARLNADKILAEKLQEEEREMYTIEQRAKLLHDTIAAQRRFLAQQRSEAIRNKPPSRNQLRNQMMTYLKHVGGKKHSDLKAKTFEEIQVLYERLKRQDQNFVAIGSAEDERQIKELNKDPEKKKLKKRVVNEEDTAKVPAEQEVTEQGTKKRKSGHVKMIARKRPRPQPDDDSDDEYRKCLRIITFESTIDSEIMETKSFIARVHKVSSPDGNYLVVYRVNGHFRAFNYLMEVLHIFDRQDLFHLYDLVMKQYSEITPEDIELILWGDLKIMMESSTEENVQGDFWNNQQEWEIVRWRLYEACGVCILEFKDGTVIYMLVERRLIDWLSHKQMAFGISKEVGTPRYLILVVLLIKVGDEAVHKELGDRMERTATTASSLEAKQDSGNIK
ncbi:hypothetical protein Tco_1078806 [Tanacetum coccineum]|uniref:Uncharacterized protein n=1 Tax=Tanacetum coccineum TaxID=301880 RepID=A0ABQ5HQ10_9ASTR